MRTTYCACVLTTHLTTIIRANLFRVLAAAVQLANFYPPLVPPILFILLVTFSLLFVVFFFFNLSVSPLGFHANLSVIKAEVEGTLAGSSNPPGTKFKKHALQAFVN